MNTILINVSESDFSEDVLSVFGMNKSYSCTYLQFFHVDLQNDSLVLV